MKKSPPTPPNSTDGWQEIFESQVDLAQWGPRRRREDRGFPRLPWTGHVRVRVGRRVYSAQGIDLSERGIRVRAPFKSEMGTTVAVTLDLFGRLVHAVGEVSWIGEDEGYPAIGVRFSVMRRTARHRLANYVSSRVYNPQEPAEPCPWDDGKTLPHRSNATPPFIPSVPSYVPVRTGHTVSIPIAGGHRQITEHGSTLERIAALVTPPVS